MRVRTKLCEAIGVLSAVSLLACGQATSVTAPSATTGTNGPITSIVVMGPATSGTNFQLMASGKSADGSSRDITAVASWKTSDPTKVSISSTGWVTILALGTVNVQATYQSVTGSMQVKVTPPPPDKYVLSGVVREVPPTSRPVAGAVIRITAGPDAGIEAASDGNGLYAIAGLSAGFAIVETSAPGYTVSSVGLDISGNRSVDLWLAPTPPRDASGATATARCSDGSWSWAQSKTDACSANGGIAYPVCPGVMCPDASRKTR